MFLDGYERKSAVKQEWKARFYVFYSFLNSVIDHQIPYLALLVYAFTLISFKIIHQCRSAR